jgi:hypothetical protein
MPKLDKLKIKKFRNSWFVDIKLEIGEDESEYWDLETEEEVEDFVNYTLTHN